MFTTEIIGNVALVTVYDSKGRRLTAFKGPAASLYAVRNDLVFQGYAEVTKADVAQCRYAVDNA